MIRSAAKLGFFGVLVYFFAKVLYSLLRLIVVTLGLVALFAALFAWLWVATANGYL